MIHPRQMAGTTPFMSKLTAAPAAVLVLVMPLLSGLIAAPGARAEPKQSEAGYNKTLYEKAMPNLGPRRTSPAASTH